MPAFRSTDRSAAGSSWPRRARLVPGLALALLSTLLVTSATEAAATVSAPAPAFGRIGSGMVSLASIGPAVDASGGSVVTLPTGDKVTFLAEPSGGGRPVARVDPAPRPAGAATVSFLTENTPRGFYVFPSDTLRAVQSGVLDRELFNVKGLIAEGFDDAHAAALPMIAQYPASGGTPTPPGTDQTRPLPAINAAALQLDKKRATAFWRAVAPAPGSGQLFGGIARLWLDQRVRVSDQVSDQQIGAPTAWGMGLDGTGVTVAVLDTGIDATHPDLVGKVVAAQNFSDDTDTLDHFGHGTHVASIVAGTGAASNGLYKGVAPGAKLLNGKVLDQFGFGLFSWVMAGMEWAAEHEHATIINMSLGGCCGQDSDPLSQEVDTLTAQTGALFVIAAGNQGPGNVSLGTPGSATAALTVGAVDASDTLAPFSSRGPRFNDAAVKPEIVAPGVHIIAARASGTSLGTVINQFYTQLSGTSMATPMVAGAAAILAQQHPAWGAGSLKEELVSTAHDDGYTWYQQGAGRVDVAHAVTSTLEASAEVDLGTTASGGAPVTEPLTYTNFGSQPATLTLSLSSAGFNGQPAPAAITLGATSVSVPAGGTAAVPVTFHPAAVPFGAYGGTVVASTGTTTLRTPVGGFASADVPLSAQAINALGQPACSCTAGDFAVLVKQDRDNPADANDPFIGRDISTAFLRFDNQGNSAPVEVAPGNYSIEGEVMDNNLDFRRITLLAATNVMVNGPTSVTLDARAGVPLRNLTDQPTEQAGLRGVTLLADPAGIPRGQVWSDGVTAFAWPGFPVHVTPVAPETAGTFSLQDQSTLQDPVLQAQVLGGETLHPLLFDEYAVSTKLAGHHQLPVVFAGDGQQPVDFAATAGKAALVRLHAPAGTTNPVAWAYQAVQTAAANANAATTAVLPYLDTSGALPVLAIPPGVLPYGPKASETIPTLSLSNAEGDALYQQLKGGGATLVVDAKPNPAFVDNLNTYQFNGIPTDLTQSVNQGSLIAIPTRYHAEQRGLQLERTWFATAPSLSGAGVGNFAQYPAPAQWTEYAGFTIHGGPAEQPQWLRSADLHTPAFASWLPGIDSEQQPGPAGLPEDWFQAPFTLGTPPGFCTYCRLEPNPADPTGATDLFIPSTLWTDSTPGHFGITDDANNERAASWTLFRNGQQVSPDPTFPEWALGPDSASYLLQGSIHLPAKGAPSTRVLRDATQVDTTWTFQSERSAGTPCSIGFSTFTCAGQPLIQLHYQFGLDLYDQAPAGQAYTFTVSTGFPPFTVNTSTVTHLDLSYSTDEGKTWRRAAIRALGGGQYQVTVIHPTLDQTGGFVWLHTQATDAAGDTVDQTMQRAYALTDQLGTPPPGRP